jgi:hypothetical protein
MIRRLVSLAAVVLAACVPAKQSGGGVAAGPECATSAPAPSSAELGAWQRTKRTGTAEAYRSFLAAWPNSCFAGAATARLATLAKPPARQARTLNPVNDFATRRAY